MLPPRNFENMLILPSILAFGSQLITKCYSLNLQYHLSFVVLFGKVLHIVGGRVLMKEVTGGCSLFIEWTHLSSTCQSLFKYMEPTNHGLNLLKPLDKINSFKLFPVFFSQLRNTCQYTNPYQFCFFNNSCSKGIVTKYFQPSLTLLKSTITTYLDTLSSFIPLQLIWLSNTSKKLTVWS